MGCEDIENQFAAIENLFFGDLLEIANLSGREIIIENDRVNLVRLGTVGYLVGLAGPHVQPRVHLTPLCDDLVHYVRASSAC